MACQTKTKTYLRPRLDARERVGPRLASLCPARSGPAATVRASFGPSLTASAPAALFSAGGERLGNFWLHLSLYAIETVLLMKQKYKVPVDRKRQKLTQ